MDAQQLFGNFLAAIKTCFSKYLDANGRATRSEFWYFFLFSMIISALFNGGAGNTGLISLILFIPSITVGIRRLHDVDKSGWWLFIVLIPLFGWLFLLYTWAQEGNKGANQFGSEPENLDPYEFEEDAEPVDFNYEDLPQADDLAEDKDVEDEASRTKDRYGREIGKVEDKRKKGSDFLEG